jgi:hypothetical protein
VLLSVPHARPRTLTACRARAQCWKLWVPMQAINFSIMPVHMRVPFAAGVSFVWSCILSALRGEMKPVTRAKVA